MSNRVLDSLEAIEPKIIEIYKMLSNNTIINANSEEFCAYIALQDDIETLLNHAKNMKETIKAYKKQLIIKRDNKCKCIMILITDK